MNTDMTGYTNGSAKRAIGRAVSAGDRCMVQMFQAHRSERVRRLGDNVGGNAVKGQNQQNRHPAQISEWQAGFGHGLKSLKCRRRRGESVLFIDINRETAAKFHTAQTWLRIFERDMVSHTLPGRRGAQLLAPGRSSIGP